MTNDWCRDVDCQTAVYSARTTGSVLRLEFGEDGLEAGRGLQALQVGILRHPVVVRVATIDRLLKRAKGIGLALGQGEAAGEIVVGGGVVGLKFHQLAVHFKPVGDPPRFCVESAEQFDDVGVGGFAAQHRFIERDVEGRVFFARHGDQAWFLQTPVC